MKLQKRIAVLLVYFTLCACVYFAHMRAQLDAERIADELKAAAYSPDAHSDKPASAHAFPQSATQSSAKAFAEPGAEANAAVITGTQSTIAWDRLKKKNSDTVAWIKIGGTKTDNVVVQGEDNDYYLGRDIYGKKSKYGTLYIDAGCRLFGELSQNITIYGHNMKDGKMFGGLKRYRDLEFFKKHPLINFELEQGAHSIYKVFAIFIINAYPEQDGGYAFNYRKSDFASQDEFLGWAKQCQSRSIINTSVDIQRYDQVITLSTCTYEFEQARLVVMARALRPGEGTQTPHLAQVNPNPLYPEAYKK